MRSLKRKIASIGWWIWFQLRIYYLWSRFYRWTFERKQYGAVKLTSYDSLQALEDALGQMQWIKDGPKYLWDTISLPERVEYQYQKNPMKEVGDCDEFATYAASRIRDMMDRGVLKGITPYFMSMGWLDSKGKYHGHNICLFFDDTVKKWGHVGNWFSGEAQKDFSAPADIAKWFANYQLGEVIGYSYCTPDLKKLIEVKIPPL